MSLEEREQHTITRDKKYHGFGWPRHLLAGGYTLIYFLKFIVAKMPKIFEILPSNWKYA